MEKVLKLGLKKEKGYLYVINKDGIIRKDLKTASTGEWELVMELEIKIDNNYHYLLDKDGDIKRILKTGH